MIYGILLLKSKKMQEEFIRFKLEKFIVLVGILELLGGIGLIIGINFSLILISSSLGLGLLMFLGFLTRIKLRDSFLLTFPSLFFMLINFYIFMFSLKEYLT
jgi:hypothetical protein